MLTVTRFVHKPERLLGNGNITFGHPAERASWIWSPDQNAISTAFLHFSLPFDWSSRERLRLHCTADHRYQLFLDGEAISYGPDRSDVAHWAVTSLDIELPSGPHRLEAYVWFIAEAAGSSRLDPKHAGGDLSLPNPPMGQMSHRPGFLLAGDETLVPGLLDTGAADWQVADLSDAVRLEGPCNLGYHDIGPGIGIDLATWNMLKSTPKHARVVSGPAIPNIHGVRTPGWVLTPTDLPEQKRESFTDGRIRSVRGWTDENAPWTGDGGSSGSRSTAWQDLLDSSIPVELAANQSLEILWDFESYQCGYPILQWSGGAGAEIHFDWAESLYEHHPNDLLDAETPKGHRGEIDGKVWLGFGDVFVCSGAVHESAPALWWRSGRYVRLRVKTGDTPLQLEKLGILTTGYPFERGWNWQSSDAEWDAVLPLIARGLELGAHETWADSPHYEQMPYVGDNLLHMLSNYACYPDLRLTKRCLELFDWSRDGSLAGLVAERYPAAWRQESTTYAMLYPTMLRNHLMWCDDTEFLRARLPGLRQLMESLLALRQPNGLLGVVPGWPFVDWVSSWNQGCGPGVREGDSSLVNLHLVLALQAAAELEMQLGEKLLAGRWATHAEYLAAFIWERYGFSNQGLLADTPGSDHFSEHAQVLALLTDLLPPERADRLVNALCSMTLPARCTIYFAHYLFEVLKRFNRPDAFFARLQFWRELPGLGFTALPESPEPSRSDCHGWGAHPLFHTFASIAGIRPASPGFCSVGIRPMPGSLTHFKATTVHPKGKIQVEYSRKETGERFRISLPEGLSGTLHWRGEVHKVSNHVNFRFAVVG